MNTKETNPKDGIGASKTPLSVLPAQVLQETALALYEGGRKYGVSNYRLMKIEDRIKGL